MFRVISFFIGTNTVLFTLAFLLSIIGVGGVEGSSPNAGAAVTAIALLLWYILYRRLKSQTVRLR